MIVVTHILIAQEILRNIEAFIDVGIDKNYFVYGNIKPDMVYGLAIKSHELKDSLNLVINMVNHLINCKEISIKQFSVDLGVINHFLSDFFCTAHNQEISKMNTIEHLYYEINLHYEFKKLKDKNHLKLDERLIHGIKRSSIVNTILSSRASYLKQKSSAQNDIRYTISISTLISIIIIENSVLFNKKRIA